MRDERRQKFAPYIRHLADLMYLRDWTFELHDTPPDNARHGACVYVPFGRCYCNVYVNDKFLDFPPAIQRSTLVHELLHCHFEPMRESAMQALSKREYKLWNIAFERGIDQTAMAWAESLPLPEFPNAENQEEKKEEEQVSPLPQKPSLEAIS
jgi:hypothetical protein